MLLLTLSGSTYEVNYPDMLIRRVSSPNPATPRFGTDGEWRSFVCVLSLLDRSMLILWDEVGKATLTSPVVDVV